MAVRPFIRATRSVDPAVRVTAILALAEMGEAGREALPALTAILREKDMTAACELYMRSAGGGPLYESRRKRIHQDTRIAAIEALGSLGRAAVPALTEALEDSDPDIRQKATEALQKARGKG